MPNLFVEELQNKLFEPEIVDEDVQKAICP
jgi:hypothetical protein